MKELTRTSKKVSKLSCNSCTLAMHYSSAHETIFGHTIRVSKTAYGKFRVMEDDLRQLNVESLDYAYTVVTLLYEWAKSKNLTFVPVNIFCSDWVLAKYLKVHKSMWVDVDTKPVDHLTLIQDEMSVATKYINDNLSGSSRLRDVIAELKPMLSDTWMKLYANDERQDLMYKVMDIICENYGMQEVCSYNDIIHELRKRNGNV